MSSVPATQNGELWNAYDDPSVPLECRLALLWATGDADGWLADQLAAETSYRCMRTAGRGGNRTEPVRAAKNETYSSSEILLGHLVGAELARHALVRSMSETSTRERFEGAAPAKGTETRFVAELIGVTTEHLAWKDLAGLVGLVRRVRTIPKAQTLERDLASAARSSVVGSPPPVLIGPEAFAVYMRETMRD